VLLGLAAPHYCFNDNTDHLDIDGNPLEHGSPWFRAKGSESTALRLPFGCAVLFYPSPTKLGDVPAKWEGTAIAGVFAGYRMKPGYDWDGEYYCWSFSEMITVNLQNDKKEYSPSVRTPHRTKRVVLPPGPIVFPLKASWDEANLTLAGKRAAWCEPEEAEAEEPGVPRGMLPADASSVAQDVGGGAPRGTPLGPVPPDAAELKLREDADDLHGGLGIEKNKDGVRCRRDTAGKLYPIDKIWKKFISLKAS
jgi:hypothetical protein